LVVGGGNYLVENLGGKGMTSPSITLDGMWKRNTTTYLEKVEYAKIAWEMARNNIRLLNVKVGHA